MAHDVICAKDTVDADRPEFAMTENAEKFMLHNIWHDRFTSHQPHACL